MKQPFAKFSVIIVLIQLVTVFFMIAAAGWGYTHAEKINAGTTNTLEFWYRWSIPLLVVPVSWFIAVTVAAAENRFPKVRVVLHLIGIVVTAVLLYEAFKLLMSVIQVAGNTPMSM